MNSLKWCTNCLAMSTRPRITFNEKNECNACTWSKQKKKYNWNNNLQKLNQYLKKKIRNKNNFNCIVPVSGGKDGSYVYDRVINKLKLNPLAVTVNPHLPQNLGKINLENFVNSGTSLIEVNPPYEAMRRLNYLGFKHIGFPYYGWLIAIHTAVIRIANNFEINLIFYGEDGELEYGGTNETNNKIFYNPEYQKKIYLENYYNFIIKKSKLKNKDKYFFSYPKKNIKKIMLTHYSYYENWNPYKNYLIAKKKYGLQENKKTNVGTFSNFAQNDQKLYALHTYLMYLKFGFGRANQDASIEVRRGAMKRTQAVELVKLYDNQYPAQFEKNYLNYFNISKNDFDSILDRWANKKLFFKKKGRWHPKFEIK
jgi:N-acetyl sugar amidotransferase